MLAHHIPIVSAQTPTAPAAPNVPALGTPSPAPSVPAPPAAEPAPAPPPNAPTNSSVTLRLAPEVERALDVAELAFQASLTLGAIAGIGLLWIAGRRTQQRLSWQRADLARQTVEALCRRESFQRVLAILRFEEYRDLIVDIPAFVATPDGGHITGHTLEKIVFEATDDRLKRALRRHGEMVMLKEGFNQILHQGIPDNTRPNFDLDRAIKEFQQEFHIELTLRDWFDDFLGGLSHLDAMIQTNLIGVQDLEPYIGEWIRLIADRAYRRETGSNFYDQLFTYIHHSQCQPVLRLFKRFGYTIIAPPYESKDFRQFPEHETLPDYDLKLAIALAKAAYLSYEHKDYIGDIVQQWTLEDMLPDYRDYKQDESKSAGDFVYAMMNYCHDRTAQRRRDANTKYEFFESQQGSDTQAYAFKIGRRIVLVFRGTQQLADWLTNADFLMASWENQNDPFKGLVHNGFQTGWLDIRRDVIKTLKKWQEPGDQIWVTGHSLGGALATLAAASLKEQGFPVTHLYTFGQPRTGNGIFLDYFNSKLGFGIQGQRFVNSTDIVPRVPLRLLSWRFWLRPWDWRFLYGHGSNLRYFNFRRKLWEQSSTVTRVVDGIVASLVGLFIPGWGFLTNHSMELYLLNLQRAEAERQKAKAQEESDAITQKMTTMIRQQAAASPADDSKS